MRRLALLLVLLSGLSLAGGRAGYFLEAGQRFSVRLWAEQVLTSFGGFEQVAGAEVTYDERGWYFVPYTGIGYSTDSFWIMLQFRVSPSGAKTWALMGGGGW